MILDMPDAILMVADPLSTLNRKRVFEFAAAHRLPAIYELSLFVRDGGLMSYGPDLDESFGRVAALVDRISPGWLCRRGKDTLVGGAGGKHHHGDSWERHPH